MDPLSIGSAVVGLIATAARVAPMLHHFVSHARDAPKSASQILEEMNSITSALEQLQVYLMGAYRTNAARRSMLSLRNIVATLTACVTTYSDLELLVKKCMSNGKVKAFKWVMNESDVGGLLERVQAHKLSLVFMLTILQCESAQEAKDTMHRLVELVEGFVESNTDLRNRLDAIAADHGSVRVDTKRSSVMAPSLSSTAAVFPQRKFEEDLNNSRVYRKLRRRDSIYSIDSSQRASLTSSAFSELSLGNVSIISVLCLPVWSADLGNAEYYRFGREGLTMTMAELAERYPHIEYADLGSLEDYYSSDVDDESADHHLRKEPEPVARTESRTTENMEGSAKNRHKHSTYLDYYSFPATPVASPTNLSIGALGIESDKDEPEASLSIESDKDEPEVALSIESDKDEPEVALSIEPDKDEPEVLFMAASLFEFNVSADKKEAGIPYLTYSAGEIFHILGVRGELWLARNRKDSLKTVGWIWEKHFARILSDEASDNHPALAKVKSHEFDVADTKPLDSPIFRKARKAQSAKEAASFAALIAVGALEQEKNSFQFLSGRYLENLKDDGMKKKRR